VIECVPNFSEGRDAGKVRAIVEAIERTPGVLLLGWESDVDHNRSVVTFAGEPEAVMEGAICGAWKAAQLIDIRVHGGVHPRVGVADVIPFVPLKGSTLDDCVEIAHRTGEELWRSYAIPVYFYEAAARIPERRRLEKVRRPGFDGKPPDVGNIAAHPEAGASVIGARGFLIAFNVNLHTADLSVAKDIARAIRTSSGGFPALKALGFALPSRGQVQVSMNLTDFDQTPLHVAYEAVARLAAERGVEVAQSELIGLVPRRALEQAAAGLLKLTPFDAQRIVETRLETLQRKPPHLH
jgi:glutamate formiminotransferase